jgi:anti-anti-sigma factor
MVFDQTGISPMTLSSTYHNGAQVVTVGSDRIDAAMAIQFKEEMREQTQDGAARVILDLSGVGFIDSSGLGAIVAAMKQLGAGRRLDLAGPTPHRREGVPADPDGHRLQCEIFTCPDGRRSGRSTACAPPRTRWPPACPRHPAPRRQRDGRGHRGAVLLGICEPQMTGSRRRLLRALHPPGETGIRALNGSGRAPAGLTSADGLRAAGHTAMPDGRRSGDVPGAVDAFCRLSETKAGWAWTRVLAPPSTMPMPVCRSPRAWPSTGPRCRGPAARPRARLPSGRRRGAPPGSVFRAPGQAEVLRRIARDGRAAFYEGEVAEDMLATLSAAGGVHTLEDFAAVEADYDRPDLGRLQGRRAGRASAQRQGATAILMLNILATSTSPRSTRGRRARASRGRGHEAGL